MSSTRKRVTAAVAGAAVLGLGVASAASLGGLSSASLGAGDQVVASCDGDGMAVAYTNAYDSVSGKYRTTSVTVSGIAAACAGQSMSVTLYDSTKASIGTGTATVGATTTQVVTMTPTAAADAVTGVAVVVTG
jgi:hypothetical protein